jgi:uncharacterized membrane protein
MRPSMKRSQLDNSRLIVGIVLVIIAVLMLLFLDGDYATVGAIAMAILGLVSIAISRRSVA